MYNSFLSKQPKGLLYHTVLGFMLYLQRYNVMVGLRILTTKRGLFSDYALWPDAMPFYPVDPQLCLVPFPHGKKVLHE